MGVTYFYRDKKKTTYRLVQAAAAGEIKTSLDKQRTDGIFNFFAILIIIIFTISLYYY